MKKAVLFLLAFLCAALAAAQEPVYPGTRLTWDHPGGAEEFRIYCATFSPVPIAAPHLRAQIAEPTRLWTNDLTAGQWYCVVTAYAVGPGESGPSNELFLERFDTLSPPTNFRKEVPFE